MRSQKKKLIEPSDKGINFAKPLVMKKKILIADDDPGIRDIFKIIFERAGYDIDLKEDASEILKNNFTVPDIFLIDKLLSGVDGLDICRFLKTNPLTLDIPVVMISASPDIGVTSYQAGADDYIEKPFDLTHLLEVVQRNISLRKKRHQLSGFK
jgi:DNA-binding response OmpR family regulator